MSALPAERAEANLVYGTVSGDTAQLFQQLVSGLGGPETPIGNLYLGGAPAHQEAACPTSAGPDRPRHTGRTRLGRPGRRITSRPSTSSTEILAAVRAAA